MFFMTRSVNNFEIQEAHISYIISYFLAQIYKNFKFQM